MFVVHRDNKQHWIIFGHLHGSFYRKSKGVLVLELPLLIWLSFPRSF